MPHITNDRLLTFWLKEPSGSEAMGLLCWLLKVFLDTTKSCVIGFGFSIFLLGLPLSNGLTWLFDETFMGEKDESSLSLLSLVPEDRFPGDFTTFSCLGFGVQTDDRLPLTKDFFTSSVG